MTWTPAWMWSLGLAGLGLLAFTAVSAWAGGPAWSMARWDEGLKRYPTECTDGSRVVCRYDTGLKCWRTDIVRPARRESTKTKRRDAPVME
jgi:hypothetical protein